MESNSRFLSNLLDGVPSGGGGGGRIILTYASSGDCPSRTSAANAIANKPQL